MLFIYFIISLVMILSSKRIFATKINPISLYCTLWFFCFFIHEANIIVFDKISISTFIVLILVNVVYFLGCIVGNKLAVVSRKSIFSSRTEEEQRKLLLKIIVFLSILAMFSVIPSFFSKNLRHGFNIFNNFSSMYKDELGGIGDRESAFSLSSLVYILAVFTPVYFNKYGFTRALWLAIIDILLLGLSGGSRGSFVIVISLFLSIVIINKINKVYSIDIITTNKNKNNSRFYLLLIIIFLIIIAMVTISRARDKREYLSSSRWSILLNWFCQYMACGIGCLDKYLKNPQVVHYPQYFLRVPFIVLNKLGITNVPTNSHSATYYIPFPSNVITYIGELYHDFEFWMYVPIFFMACLFSWSFKKSIKQDLIFYKTIYSAMFAIFSLSFFTNFLRIASIWYVFVIGGFIAIHIDHKVIFLSKKFTLSVYNKRKRRNDTVKTNH